MNIESNYTADYEVTLIGGDTLRVRKHKVTGEIETSFRQVTSKEILEGGDIIRPEEIAGDSF